MSSTLQEQTDECVRKIWLYRVYGNPQKPLVPCSEADKADRINKARVGVSSGVLVLFSGTFVSMCWYTGSCGFRRRSPVNGKAVPDTHVAPAPEAAPVVKAATIVHTAPAVKAAPVAQPAPANQALIQLADNALHSAEVGPLYIDTLAHVRSRSLPTDDALLYVRHASIDAVERR